MKFAKYLPELGVAPRVVTGPGDRRTRYAPLDATLGRQAAADTPVYRTPDVLPDDGRTQRLRRWLGLPSGLESAWARHSVATGLEAAREGVDVVFATMSPFATSRAAAELAARLRVPWVADLRDPWALDETTVYPTGLHRRLDVRRMRRRLASAARIIMNTPEAGRALAEAFPELAPRTAVITNGFDAEDFDGSVPTRRDGRFRIVHTGKLHLALGERQRERRRLRRWIGGERVPIDLVPRSHAYLLQALARWQRECPQDVKRVEVVLAGEISDVDRAAIERSGVGDQVRTPGYLSHSESVALVRTADLLFVPLHSLPPGERARIVPGKTYEYLASRRPVLAALPPGDAADYLLESGTADVCPPTDVAALADALARRFAAWREGRPPTPAPDAFYRQFERRELSARLAELLRSVVVESRSPV